MITLKSEIIRKVAELGELETKEVTEDRPLRDLGIDSLMTIELVVFIEKMLHRQFPEERVGSIRTCGDIFREVETLLQVAS
jgi:acyl carrier protein